MRVGSRPKRRSGYRPTGKMRSRPAGKVGQPGGGVNTPNLLGTNFSGLGPEGSDPGALGFLDPWKNFARHREKRLKIGNQQILLCINFCMGHKKQKPQRNEGCGCAGKTFFVQYVESDQPGSFTHESSSSVSARGSSSERRQEPCHHTFCHRN